MKKIHVNATVSHASSDNSDRGNRRILHTLERRYLSPDAQAMVYSLLNSGNVPLNVTENTIQQAVALGTLNEVPVDAQTFEALLAAVTLNPSFRIPSFSGSEPAVFPKRFC